MTKNRVADGVIVIPAPKEDSNFRTGAPVQAYGLVSYPASHVKCVKLGKKFKDYHKANCHLLISKPPNDPASSQEFVVAL